MKRSDEIRSSIGKLTYELTLYQASDNDAAMDGIQAKIEKLRSKLLSVEEEENKIHSDIEDHG